MKDYNKIISQLEKDIEKAHTECELIIDKLCVVRLEQRATHYLVDSDVKNLELSCPALINIFMSKFPHKNWNECIEILKQRKPEWW